VVTCMYVCAKIFVFGGGGHGFLPEDCKQITENFISGKRKTNFDYHRRTETENKLEFLRVTDRVLYIKIVFS